MLCSKNRFPVETIARWAVVSIAQEATLTPKPGLVDVADSGSHTDMDCALLIKSAHSLEESFQRYLLCGYKHNAPLCELLPPIRKIGMDAEREMFAASGGINTHKGANFSFGLLLAALGSFLKKGGTFPLGEGERLQLFATISEITQGLVEKDFARLDEKTSLSYGEKLYLEHGFCGIRGEAERGYPAVRDRALPLLLALHAQGWTQKRALLQTLFTLMSFIEDSNILSRGGIAALKWNQSRAALFLEAGGCRQPTYLQHIHSLNTLYREKNLSPGGSADLLAMTLFMGKLSGIYSDSGV